MTTTTTIPTKAILRALDRAILSARPLPAKMLDGAIAIPGKIRAACKRYQNDGDGDLAATLDDVIAWASLHAEPLAAALAVSRGGRGAASIAWATVGETGRYSARVAAGKGAIVLCAVEPGATIVVGADLDEDTIATSIVRAALAIAPPRAKDDAGEARPSRAVVSRDALARALAAYAPDTSTDDDDDASDEGAPVVDAPAPTEDAPAPSGRRARRG